MSKKEEQKEFWLLCRVHANPVAACFSSEIMISFPYLRDTQQWTIIDRHQVIFGSSEKIFCVGADVFLPAYVIVHPIEIRTDSMLVRLCDIDSRTLNIKRPKFLIFFGSRDETTNVLQCFNLEKILGTLEPIEFESTDSNKECINMQTGTLIKKT